VQVARLLLGMGAAINHCSDVSVCTYPVGCIAYLRVCVPQLGSTIPCTAMYGARTSGEPVAPDPQLLSVLALQIGDMTAVTKRDLALFAVASNDLAAVEAIVAHERRCLRLAGLDADTTVLSPAWLQACALGLVDCVGVLSAAAPNMIDVMHCNKVGCGWCGRVVRGCVLTIDGVIIPSGWQRGTSSLRRGRALWGTSVSSRQVPCSEGHY
jgi:hypothetical protein